jgi:cystathionine beta-lyase/cystathionine gamma-synthase
MNFEKQRATEITRQGSEIKGTMSQPEISPIYLTTAFHGGNLDELEEYYSEKGYTYNRIRNPNRNALAELISYLEGGEDSIICSSGMSAISSILLTLLSSGDHIIANSSLYGESLDFLKVLEKYGIENSTVNFSNIEEVKNAIKSNTRVLYAETISNPLMELIDIESISEIAHKNNAKLIVDNTFATSLIFKPLSRGADISINSLTKFANGHSDVLGGSATGKSEIISKAKFLQSLLGCTLDPFSSFLCQRGIRTMDIRLEKQMHNALELAKSLNDNPHVLKVNYPGLENHQQHELAKNLFKNGYGAMLSFEMPDDRKKINKFMDSLNIAKYAMTLGGYRTTLSYPAISSHFQFTKEERLKMGISDGLMRVSVGFENTQDLIDDFSEALKIFEY